MFVVVVVVVVVVTQVVEESKYAVQFNINVHDCIAYQIR